MTSDDLNQIRGVVKEEIAVSEKRLRADISASEQRLKEEMVASDKRVMIDIGDFMSDSIFPLLEEKADKTDIERLERKMDRSLDTNLDHESRLKDIEQISVVAHELKIRRAK